jgi:nucleotidyltransferase substrate binding protein (TIGR01987 family)
MLKDYPCRISCMRYYEEYIGRMHELKEEWIDKVILFGSRARGDNSLKSDIDLAIYADNSSIEFIEEIEMNTHTLLEFDFSDMNVVRDEFFIEQIKKEGIVIYENVDFKYMNLKKAYDRLVEVSELYDGKNDIIRDSLIQRFEFTYELTHKTLQEFMKYLGVTLENSFPRTIFKKAYVNNLISDELVWISLLEDRNSTSHIYNEKLADEIANRIVDKYVNAIEELVSNLEKLK